VENPPAGRKRRRTVLAALAILAVGVGTWVFWPQQRHWEEITLDLGNNVTMRLVLIPAGKFTMGSPDSEPGRYPDEGPQHEVTISRPFYMGVHEVTQEQYQQVMGANPSFFKGQPANPVEMVFWDDAMEFCQKLSEKTGKKVALPTEAQWEYACRAGTTTAFHTGDELKPTQANADFSASGPPGVLAKAMAWVRKFLRIKAKAVDVGMVPVGSFPPNGFGLYDMHGNVWEWCSGWYDDSYASAKNIDPTGPASGTLRVLRGGCWGSIPRICRSADRNRSGPDYRFGFIGFRVVVLSGVDLE
jgi:formylglycine-generating enzyme required for sulfatase activity